jgi:hypothetical protein
MVLTPSMRLLCCLDSPDTAENSMTGPWLNLEAAIRIDPYSDDFDTPTTGAAFLMRTYSTVQLLSCCQHRSGPVLFNECTVYDIINRHCSGYDDVCRGDLGSDNL